MVTKAGWRFARMLTVQRAGHSRECRVTVDVHEGTKMLELLAAEGLAVDRRRLHVGDYLVGAYGVVERKTVLDLHLSLLEGRLWLQLSLIRAAPLWPYLLVEGTDLDCGPVGRRQVRGALLKAAEKGVRVLRSADRADSARWLYGLAMRGMQGHRSRPPYALGSPPTQPADAAEAMLAAVPGISFHTARALLARFGSVQAVVAAKPSDWLTVEGVGPQRAAALEQVLMLSQPPALSAKAQPPST